MKCHMHQRPPNSISSAPNTPNNTDRIDESVERYQQSAADEFKRQ